MLVIWNNLLLNYLLALGRAYMILNGFTGMYIVQLAQRDKCVSIATSIKLSMNNLWEPGTEQE